MDRGDRHRGPVRLEACLTMKQYKIAHDWVETEIIIGDVP